jgi:hypothetical protein
MLEFGFTQPVGMAGCYASGTGEARKSRSCSFPLLEASRPSSCASYPQEAALLTQIQKSEFGNGIPEESHMRVLESRALLLLLLCLAGSIHIASAQVITQEPGEVVRVNTDLVQTHVTVVDRQNRFVEGLSQNQFELRVDGKAAPIVFFDRVKGNPTEAQSVKVAYPGVTTASVAGRRIIFFVDDVHLGVESIDPVRKGLLHFIEHEMLPGDEVMIASASGQLGFLQQFSENPAVLSAAVAKINRRPNSVQDTENVAISE